MKHMIMGDETYYGIITDIKVNGDDYVIIKKKHHPHLYLGAVIGEYTAYSLIKELNELNQRIKSMEKQLKEMEKCQ